MVYTVNIFADLCKKYSTWTDLEQFLQSPEGGSLRIIQDTFGGSNEQISKEVIIRYEKGVSDFTIPHVRWFRSVVWNTETNRPLCVAPPKASTIDTYGKKPASSYVYQNFLDGVMVNAYSASTYSSNDPMRLVTRSSFDATGTFYSQRPFSDLVYEAFHKVCIMDDIRGPTNLESWLPSKEDMHISSFMSLLLQHPEHRVVNKVFCPQLFVVHTGTVDEDGVVTIDEDLQHHAISNIEAPDSSLTLQQWVSQLSEKNGWDWQGVIIKDGEGNRWRIRSNVYRMIRSLRGNSSRDEVRFAQLFSNKLIDTYLYYYPEDIAVFSIYSHRIHTVVKILYDRYVRTHITKTLHKINVEPMWKPHLFALHGYYLYSLKPNKYFIREKDVQQYVENLSWQQILYLITQQSQQRYTIFLE